MTDKTTPERQPVADALPPLPASQAFSLTRSVYTADDMHAYARAALASRDAEIAKLRQGEPFAFAQEFASYPTRLFLAADFPDMMTPCAMSLHRRRTRQPQRMHFSRWATHPPCVEWIDGVTIRPLFLASPPPAQPQQAEPLSEADIVRCAVESGCVGTVKMTFDSGPYEITRTSINADRFARAIERLITERMSAGGTK